MSFFQGLLDQYLSWKNRIIIEEGVKKVISNHSDSLKELELYDRGELPISKDMVKHKTVRSYIRGLQKDGDFSGRATSSV